MNIDSMVSRLFFGVAFAFLAVSALEKIVNGFGYTILRNTYTAGRLLEFATILLVFVIAILLRQMREVLRKAKG